MIQEIISSLEAMNHTLRRAKAVNVNDQATKDQSIALAHRYFTEARPLLIRSLGEAASILEHDELWQRLVRLAHGNNARNTYLQTVRKLRKDLSEFNIQILTVGAVTGHRERGQSDISPEEKLLLETLEQLVPSAAASYRQGLTDLKEGARLSFRGTATEFREALRETLDHLAPDDDVTKQDGFRFEANQRRPTTKQKVGYVLSSRRRNRTQRSAAEKSVTLVEELAGEITRAVYNHASLAAHVQQSKREVERIKRYVDTVLFDLLEISSRPTD
jgi:Predicted pPIWI-associating nuclease